MSWERRLTLSLPAWLVSRLAREKIPRRTVEARMELVLELARENVERGTGGPFGAAVFSIVEGRLLAAGVNRVVPAKASWAHAEIIALWGAEKVVGSHHLRQSPWGPCELVSSAEPCAMCLGSLPWAGIRRLVCGAAEADVRAIGFDEGQKPSDWKAGLRRRGIWVQTGVRRAESLAVLQLYRERGGPIY